jgi:multiple sugar transport system permease protein
VTSVLSETGTEQGRGPKGSRPRRGLPTWTRSVPLVPAVFLLAVFFVGPVIWAVYGSFTNLALTGRHARSSELVGLQNYADLLKDPSFPNALWLTVVFVVASAVIGQNALGMLLALMMRHSSTAVASVTRTIIVITWIMPEIVGAFVLYAYFNKSGTLNAVLGLLGITGTNWLFEFPMFAIVLANIWRGTAFSMMVYQAALSEVPPELTESAMIDGAGGRQRFFQVTLPVIRPTVATNLMLTTLQTLAVFTLIWVMTAGGPVNASSTLPVLAFQVAFRAGNIGYGTAIATVMLLVGAVFAAVYVRALRPGRS